MSDSTLAKANPAEVKDTPENLQKNIWSVAGGKGGTGKSVLAANLGIGLALIGYDVILIDGDLGVPNLHNYLKIKNPKTTLDDFLSGNLNSLSDAIIDTPLDNLRFISGATNLIGIANMPYSRKQKLIRHINKLTADVIIVDLGAGISHNTIDFFNISSRGLVISNPEPNANQDSYFFLKNALYRKMLSYTGSRNSFVPAVKEFVKMVGNGTFDFSKFKNFLVTNIPSAHQDFEEFLESYSPRLIMNKIRLLKQNREGPYFVSLVKTFLDIDMQYLGGLNFDKRIIQSSENIVPFLFQFPKAKITRKLFDVIDTLNNYEMNYHTICSFKDFRQLLKDNQRYWM